MQSIAIFNLLSSLLSLVIYVLVSLSPTLLYSAVLFMSCHIISSSHILSSPLLSGLFLSYVISSSHIFSLISFPLICYHHLLHLFISSLIFHTPPLLPLPSPPFTSPVLLYSLSTTESHTTLSKPNYSLSSLLISPPLLPTHLIL